MHHRESKPSKVRVTTSDESKPGDSKHGLGSTLSPFSFQCDYARTLQQMMRSRYDAVAQEQIPDQLLNLVTKIRHHQQPR